MSCKDASQHMDSMNDCRLGSGNEHQGKVLHDQCADVTKALLTTPKDVIVLLREHADVVGKAHMFSPPL